MKKLSLFLVILLGGLLLFTSCSKDDEPDGFSEWLIGKTFTGRDLDNASSSISLHFRSGSDIVVKQGKGLGKKNTQVASYLISPIDGTISFTLFVSDGLDSFDFVLSKDRKTMTGGGESGENYLLKLQD